MKALVGAFNQEEALVGAFSVIVQPFVEPMEHYTALIIINIITAIRNNSRHVCKVVCAARVRSLVMDSEELLQLELLVDGVETQDLLLADGGANRQVQL